MKRQRSPAVAILPLFVLASLTPACSQTQKSKRDDGLSVAAPAGVTTRGAAPERGMPATVEPPDAVAPSEPVAPPVTPPEEVIQWDAFVDPYDAVLASYAGDDVRSAEIADWASIFPTEDPVGPEAAGVTERGAIYLLGCKVEYGPLGPDFGALKRCLENKVRDAERRARDAVTRSTNRLIGQLKAAKTRAEAEANRVASLLTSYRREIAKLKAQLESAQAALRRQAQQAAQSARTQADRAVASLQQQVTNLERRLRAAETKANTAAQRLSAALVRETELRSQINALTRKLQQAGESVAAQLPWQKSLFAVIEDLRLDDLFRCLETEARSGNADFLRAIEQFQADPAAFAARTFSELSRELSTKFARIFRDELRDLTRSGAPPSERELALRAIGLLAVVAEDSGPGRCVFEQIRPELEARAIELARVARQMAEQLERDAIALFEREIAPAVYRGIAQPIRDVVATQLRELRIGGAPRVSANLPPQISKLLLTEDEMKAIAHQVLFKRNVNERFKIAERNLAVFLNSRTAPAAARASLADLRRITRGTEDYPALYLEIGVEFLRAIAHKFVESDEIGHGGYMINQAIGLLQLGEGTVEKVASAICGLVPEVGAAVCAVVEEIVDVLWNQGAVQLVEATGRGLINSALDGFFDLVSAELTSGKTIATIKAAIPSPLDEILSALPQEQVIGLWAGAVLQDEISTIDNVFSQIVTLAEKSSG